MPRQLFLIVPSVVFMLLSAGCTTKKTVQPLSSQSPQEPGWLSTCLAGCPTGGSARTIIRDAYTLNNNSDTKMANWVAYKITKNSQASGRARTWRKDPALPDNETLSPSAYNHANAALDVDRGHQAPLASLANTKDWPSLNYLSNITPQKSALNQGAWAQLEDKERKLANRTDINAVNVVTGPLFEHKTATLPGMRNVAIPSGYWKVLFTGVSPEKGKYAAFLMNQETPRNSNFCHYQVTVGEIEKRARPRLQIWSALPDEIAETIKHDRGTLARDLGCDIN